MRFERSLATVLFTDIVGSTERAAELRDAAWRDLRHEHERRVRRELRRFGGHEISTAGDSFLATFTSPARAIACAGAIREALLELGLQIRAGLHMGELEREGAELGGLGVHIGALAPGTRTLRNFRLVSALTFGNEAARVRAMAALDTTSAPLPFVAQDLSNARFLETKSEVLNMALNGAHPFLPSFAAQTLFGTLLFRGRLEEALAVSHHPAVVQRRGELLYEAHVRGFAVPDDQLSIALALASADTTDVFGVLYAGAFAAERGRWGDHGVALARLRSIERDAGQSTDSTKARLAGGVALALEGVEAWRRDGRLGEARGALDQARTSVTGHFREGTANRIIRWWLGELLIQNGEPREAARYFRSLASGDAFVSDPVASYRLGQLHERLGEYRDAREQYEYFLTAWRDPDPGLRSRREEAREALLRLEGSRRG